MVELLHSARKCIFYLVGWLEFVISVLAVVGIITYLLRFEQYLGFFQMEGLSDYLRFLFDALIGIELVKLLCRNDLYSMIEVLLFTVTRHLVIQPDTMAEILLGITAIAILFAVRKFLFIHPESYEKMKRRREYMD